MRIVAGAHKGHTIAAPKGDVARPTTDRVRESLFNLLAHAHDIDWTGLRVIDLFAGSGALGLEAISRGASFCLFVENDSRSRGAIRDNVEALGLYGCTRIHRRDATHLGPKPANLGAPFDVAFLDPPYRQALVEPTLAALTAGEWLQENALISIETSTDETVQCPEAFEEAETRRYGDTQITLLRRIS